MTNTFANKTAERLTAISTNLIGSSRWCKPVSKKLDVVDAWAASKNLTHPYPQASVDRKEIEALFVHILQLAREMGVLEDGTIGWTARKIHANASRHSALPCKHAGKIEEQLKAEVAGSPGQGRGADAAEPPQSSGSAASSAYPQSSDPKALVACPRPTNATWPMRRR